MPVRRIPRARTRAAYWTERLGGAGDGEQALADAWRWFRSELTAAAERRPETAQAAAWDMARQLAAYAARLPRARIPLRPGLTEAEARQLLDPWAKRDGDSG